MFKKSIVGLMLLLFVTACNQVTAIPTSTASEEALVIPSSTLPATLVPASETPEGTITATLAPVATATVGPVMYGPNDFPESVNPLTGLTVSDPSLLDRRPLAFKINLVPRTYYRPVWGLSSADIVYDFYHNDGYSRLHAIFYGQDAELVGAIRSARMLDQDLVRMYQSIFAYGSADALINSRLMNSEYSYRVFLEGKQADCPPTIANPFCRFEPKTVDLMLSSTDALSKHATAQGVDNVRQNLSGMSFNSQTPSGGSPGEQVFIRYSGDNYTRWDYDPASGSYLHFQDAVFDQGGGEEYEPLIDRLNDEQISAENVVVLLVRHEYIQQPPAEIVDFLFSGQGKAYAFRDGQRYELTWNRPGLNTPLFLTYADGTAFPFKPGQTWFQVVGTSTLITQPEDNSWRFVHWMP